MSSPDSSIIQQLACRLDAMQTVAEDFSQLLTDARYLLQKLSTESHIAEDPSGSGTLWRVIENGRETLVPQAKITSLCSTSPSHLLLHIPDMRLRYVPMHGDHQGEATWTRVSDRHCKILRLGMLTPRSPFGHLSYNRLSKAVRIEAKSLSRYMVWLTKLLQGGGTKGPYVWRVSGVSSVSATGHGYFFDERWRYIVIDGPQ